MFRQYPYINYNDLNLDWILRKIREVEAELNVYLDNSVITFADPITWDITNQYTSMTVVVDSDGTAYISKQPVPAGVAITNTAYWLPIFNYDDNINTLRSQIAYNAQDSATTAVALSTGDLVFWEGLLYKVLVDMPAGTAFIDGSNIESYTVDEKINDIPAAVDTMLDGIRDTIAYNAQDSATTSAALSANDLVYWQGNIYRVTTDMAAGTAFVIGANIESYTVDAKINDAFTAIADVKDDIFYATPEMFGAAGDGVTDDTAAIQDAINAVISGDYKALLMNNTYLVSSTFNISNDVDILGNGKIVFASAMDVFYVTDCRFTLRGITFEGPAATDGNNGYHTVTIYDTSDSVIEKCKFIHVDAESAIYVISALNTVVRENLIRDFSFIGILIYRDCTNTIVENNIILSCVNTSSGYGIQNNIPAAGGEYARDLIIKNNIIKFVRCWDGIMSHGGTNISIIGNICDDCRTGIDCSAKYIDSDSVQENYVIANNILIGSADTSYPGSNINMGIIFGYDNSSVSDGCVISGNMIKNYNIGTGGNTGGIRLANCKNVDVTGNTIEDCRFAMVWAANVAPCEHWNISGNHFEGNARGMSIGGGFYKEISIVGNSFYSTGANIWGFSVGSGARLLKCFEKNNTFDNMYEAPPSSGARQTFYTEFDTAINASQSNSIYQRGDRVYSNASSISYIGWVATNTGINASTAWTANTVVAVGALVSNAGNAYVATKAGTTGSTAPTHTSGEVADGTTSWLYVGDSSVTWKQFGAVV